MSESAPEVTLCDGCGQSDDHPKVHVWGPWRKDDRTTISDPSFHFDCLPADAEQAWGLDLSDPAHAVTAAAIEAAQGGTHGDDLRTFIAQQPSDNEVTA